MWQRLQNLGHRNLAYAGYEVTDAEFPFMHVVGGILWIAARVFFLNLPLTNPQRVLFIHTNSHTKWLYGSELQIPTLKDFHDLRRATSRCFRKDHRVD